MKQKYNLVKTLKKFLVITIMWLVFAPINDALSLVPEAHAQTVEQTLLPSEKKIVVSLDNQNLVYMEGTTVIGEFKISSGVKSMPTPKGEFKVLVKKPVVNYIGADYSYPNTKWNLLFKPNPTGNYYIHGAYWHDKFGEPRSHGCVNVAYADMEVLYNWADVDTKVIIQDGAERHARGSVVLDNDVVYFLGDTVRYPFPSEEIFFSWGHSFKDIKLANLTDLALPIGAVVESKQ